MTELFAISLLPTEFTAIFALVTELAASLAAVTCKAPRCIVSIEPVFNSDESTAFADISAFAIALAATCLATIESVAISAPVTLFAAILDVITCAVAM